MFIKATPSYLCFFYEARWLRNKALYEIFHKRNAHSVHKDRLVFNTLPKVSLNEHVLYLYKTCH